MTDPSLLASIDAEAERIRKDGSLGPGFEEHVRSVFEAIAADPGRFESETFAEEVRVEAVAPAEAPPASPPRRTPVAYSRGAVRRGLSVAKRIAGPSLRRAERLVIEKTAGSSDATALRLQVLLERAGRFPSSRIGRRLSRLGVSNPLEIIDAGLPPPAPGLRMRDDGTFHDPWIERALEKWAEALPRTAPVLHAEAGTGVLLRRLGAIGLIARGADPAYGADRRGALEVLDHSGSSSLGGVLLSGVVDRLSPAAAAALAGLVARSLQPGGRLALLSTHPKWRLTTDPVAADLARGHSLDPATWSHLFTSRGLAEISIHVSVDESGYLITAVRADGGC